MLDVPEGHWKLAGGEASAASGNHRKNIQSECAPEGRWKPGHLHADELMGV